MKKLLILTFAIIFVMLPFASFPKTIISDSDLEDMTAETGGVSIDFNNLAVKGTAALGTTSWGDSDGFPTASYNTPGFAGGNAISLSGNIISFNSTTMNIDVGTDTAAQTRVIISSMPTAMLGSMNMDATMTLSSAMNLSGGKELGRLNMQGLSTKVAADRIMFFAH